MTTTRKWTRDHDAEDDPFMTNGWASRVYHSDDGWTATRYYIPGDRGLVRPGVGWELTHRDYRGGWGSLDFDTLAAVKRFVDSPAGDRYRERWTR